MNRSENTVMAFADLPTTRPMYWSMRRELWENHSLYIAPLAVVGLALCGFFVSLIFPPKVEGLAPLNAAYTPLVLAMPYSHIGMLLMLTAFLVGVFYSLDALYGERRDRSILFWKSLPVSDRTAVLAKMSIPLMVLPALIFVIGVATQLMMLLLSLAVVLIRGGSPLTLWHNLPLFQLQLVLLYSVAVIALWHAPIYGWLLFISSWARRTTFLWAVLPLLAVCLVERIAFHTSHFGALLINRLFGFDADAFVLKLPNGATIDPHLIPLSQLSPGRFLSSAGLWIGLAVAAALIAVAIRMRRYGEPI